MRGEGVYIWDSEGERYLDFSGQAVVNFIGHGVPAIFEAVAAQASQLEFVHSSQFTTAIAEDYAAALLEFAGKHFRGGSVYFTSGGSEAVETALKLARQYQIETGQSQRYHMLSRTQSYHGSTLGALAVSGNVRRREMYIPMTREFTHVARANWRRPATFPTAKLPHLSWSPLAAQPLALSCPPRATCRALPKSASRLGCCSSLMRS